MKDVEETTGWKQDFIKTAADRIIGIQLRICRTLSHLEQKLSLRQKRVLFILFVATGAVHCACLLFHAIFSPPGRHDPVADHIINQQPGTPPYYEYNTGSIDTAEKPISTQKKQEKWKSNRKKTQSNGSSF